MSRVDRVLGCADNALRTLSGAYMAAATDPPAAAPLGRPSAAGLGADPHRVTRAPS
jgi:hypothetical protein